MTHHDQDSSVAKNVLGPCPPKQYLNLTGTIAQLYLVRMLQRTPGFIAPCLPTKSDRLPSGDLWLHEIKHDVMPVEPTVALLVRPTAMPLALPLRSMAAIRPSPLALVRRPMPLLLDHMPQTLPSRMNGTPLPARTDVAICASRTPIPCAVMVSKNRVRNERRSPLILSPAPSGAFLCRPLGTPPGGPAP
jgi:hypothetical protein